MAKNNDSQVPRKVKKKSMFFDAGPIISLTTNNLLWILEPLKKQYDGDFLITGGVKKELIDNPIKINRFKFESLQVMQLVNAGVLQIYDDEVVRARAESLSRLANSIFKAKGNLINVVHLGEIEALAAAVYFESDIFVVDERTVRLLIEDPMRLQKIMEYKLNTKVSVDAVSLRAFQDKVKGVNLIRSVELVTVAFKMGLLDKFIAGEKSMTNAREQLLDSILWGVKLHGCSVSENEIKEIVRREA